MMRGRVPCWASFAKLIPPLLPSRFEFAGADTHVRTVSVVPLVVSSVSNDIFLTLLGLQISGWRSKGQVLGRFQWLSTGKNHLSTATDFAEVLGSVNLRPVDRQSSSSGKENTSTKVRGSFYKLPAFTHAWHVGHACVKV
ncbi:hypothetical protein Taro_028126 [Colocasia esculenta]|uniref:Uncharacterized protein n=1 Tax=Colocasia esculenta TaxID=4460 RepID=A0A843VWB8_COLES|nr:hypothetical protein [Colocasia esculenta]